MPVTFCYTHIDTAWGAFSSDTSVIYSSLPCYLGISSLPKSSSIFPVLSMCDSRHLPAFKTRANNTGRCENTYSTANSQFWVATWCVNSWSQTLVAMFHCKWHATFQVDHISQRVPGESTPCKHQLCPLASPVKKTGSKLVILDFCISHVSQGSWCPLYCHIQVRCMYLLCTKVK